METIVDLLGAQENTPPATQSDGSRGSSHGQHDDCDMTMSHAWGGVSRFDGYTTYEADIDSSGHCTDRDHKSTWDAGDLPAGTVALTCFFTDSNPGVKNDLEEADTRYNETDHNFTSNGAGRGCKRQYDIQSVGTHEAGHIFGLSDLPEGHGNLTMYKASFLCSTKARTLGRGDVFGLWSIYP